METKVSDLCSMYGKENYLQNTITPDLHSKLQRTFDWLREKVDLSISNSWKFYRIEYIVQHYISNFSKNLYHALVDHDVSDISCDFEATEVPDDTELDTFLILYARLLNNRWY